jgi:hypothetical protein
LSRDRQVGDVGPGAVVCAWLPDLTTGLGGF